ncbi:MULTISPECIES: phosphatase PAP2 family protein [unclassified Streptomyces]|uniref:phosphatase PAP2 family protein n=1 Tax=unclassified Streptomyces TaxID=2593676 RepID=UPI0029B4666F|nr:phosphatase PAP2 family protein [Streptomyces sp. FL07-04A]MDX3578920.1 phosphatase PAP2 family protein [Streptomyces sp. FL07-04A]
MSSRPSRALLGPLAGPLPALLLGLPAVLFALITWQVAVGGPLLRADARLSRALVHPDRASELLADLGEVQIAVPVLVLAAGYAAWRGSTAGAARWWAPPAAALGPMLLVPLIVVPLKEWTDRPGTPAVPPATGYFPSGHTATAAVAYGSAVLVLLPWLRTALARRTAVATSVLLVLGVSFGLVRRGYHWPLDVVASWCLCTVLLGALWLLSARERDPARERGLPQERDPARERGPAGERGRSRQTVASEPPTRTTRTSAPSASRPYRGPRKPQDTP